MWSHFESKYAYSLRYKYGLDSHFIRKNSTIIWFHSYIQILGHLKSLLMYCVP
jgi:hypothetical protein